MGPAVLSAKRIGEIRMVKHIEEFHAELSAQTLSPLEILRDREVNVLEAGVAKDISAHRTECTESRWDHD